MHYASNTIIMHRNVTKVATNYMAMPPPPKKNKHPAKLAKLSMKKGSNTHPMMREYTQNGSLVMMGDRKSGSWSPGTLVP